MKRDEQPSFSSRRRWSMSVRVLVSTLAALALVMMVNYLAARHFFRFSLNFSAQADLSPLTERVLSGITNDIDVVVYFDRQEPMYEPVWGLLKEYKFASPRIRLSTVDFVTDPAAAQLIKAKYQLGGTADKNVVIFDSRGAPPRFIHAGELSELDVQPLVSGQSQEVRRTHFKGEMLFTSAILSVMNPRPLKAYFLQNHGEHQPSNDNRQVGYSRFVGLLKENNVAVETLAIFGNREIPADCHLLVIAGPRDDFLPEEIDRIDRYLKQGGRLLVLFAAYSAHKPLGLERLLSLWGVSVGNNIVYDLKNSDRAGNLVVNHIGISHPVMKPIYESAGLYLVLPRTVGKMPSSGSGAESLKVEELARTSPEGRVISDIRDGVPVPGPHDPTGSMPLIVAMEKGVVRGVSAERGATRMIVAGDSMFLSNDTIDRLANYEFATHAVNWLLARNELLASLPPRPIREYKLTITQSRLTAFWWILLLGMPGSVLLLGSLVWVRRQRW